MTIAEQREYVAEMEPLFEEYGETLVGMAIEVCLRVGVCGLPVPIADIRRLCSLWMRQLAADELARRARLGVTR